MLSLNSHYGNVWIKRYVPHARWYVWFDRMLPTKLPSDGVCELKIMPELMCLRTAPAKSIQVRHQLPSLETLSEDIRTQKEEGSTQMIGYKGTLKTFLQSTQQGFSGWLNWRTPRCHVWRDVKCGCGDNSELSRGVANSFRTSTP